jgi:hypothetical protein
MARFIEKKFVFKFKPLDLGVLLTGKQIMQMEAQSQMILSLSDDPTGKKQRA